ncbi:MAG: aminotransferase class III-fold pyridoxal phosphate-dependent enzyme [Acidobacteria bacterium]|nr:aminotransferase class III-fold pyridoxal phosphate-dependent enzyme [Acidobacteriota bacterium]
MLERKVWPERQYPLDYLGLGNWIYCNIECNYCELQTKGLAAKSIAFEPYLVFETVLGLLEQGHLDPKATVDWGGGGEPTFYKDFPRVLALLLESGTFNYIHTNGTRDPATLTIAHPENIHIICSVDAGTAETYERIKARDYFERVWRNLNAWKALGAKVSVKYIMKEESAGPEDRAGFADQCRALQPTSVILDIDFDHPNASPEVVEAIAELRHRLEADNHQVSYGHTGDRFTPEQEVGKRVERAYQVVRAPFPELVQIQSLQPAHDMEYRQVGRTAVRVSAVGIGTCQFQVLPERQAVETLLAGFERGVNLVHTAPDYGPAERYIARAMAECGRDIVVASQGFDVAGNRLGRVDHFERLFEQTCKRLGTERLELYGIACIDDREAYEENVWGLHGMVEFLQKKKQEGRLGGVYCTTHGSPEYIAGLVKSGVFDAIMLAYNALGFHLLTSPPPPDRKIEDLVRNGREIVDLCVEHEVGVLVMKPLAGGLLTRSAALPPRRVQQRALADVSPGEILRSLLADTRITSVVPGTASAAEAMENAASGSRKRASYGFPLEELLRETRETVCSRCGECESSCSQHLPLANMFRAALVNQHPSATYELHKDCEYFEVYPYAELACVTCADVSCHCPYSLPIPSTLQRLHQQMRELEAAGLIPAAPARQGRVFGGADFGARLLNWDIPGQLSMGQTICGSVHVENMGCRGWYPAKGEHPAEVRLVIEAAGQPTQEAVLTRDIQPHCRHRFVFELTAPMVEGEWLVTLTLVAQQEEFRMEAGVEMFRGQLKIGGRPLVGQANAVPERGVSTAEGLAPYGVGWLDSELPSTLPAGEAHPVRIAVENRGSRRWPAAHPSGYSVCLVVYWNGRLHDTIRLPHDVEPGERVELQFDLRMPADALRGLRLLRFTLVEQNTAWFEQHGVLPLLFTIPATEADRRSEYGVEWLDDNMPEEWPAGAAFQLYLRCRNTGSRVWRSQEQEGQTTRLAIFLDGVVVRQIVVPHDVLPDQDVLFTHRLEVPEGGAVADWRFTLVEQNVAWFEGSGARALDRRMRLGAPLTGALAEAMAISVQSNWAFWLPAECIVRSRGGRAYPSVMREGKGCRLTDVEGNSWIDMAMTGGSALLGYAHPAVQAAIGAELGSSAILTLPHVVEIEVSALLRKLFPGGEMVVFGKHGSDACTVAVRAARLHTGRRKILYSGYHGWHDWFVAEGKPELYRFDANDGEGLTRLFAEHAGQVAAVMMEPGAQAMGVHGPIVDADAEFLRRAQRLCRENGAVLIFDEIITGFRYRAGSVQHATGVVPDLTCLGKALSGGMALSALVGSKGILATTLSRAHYYPTFRGEVYSLAAAKAALGVYGTMDVPGAVERIGRRLFDGIDGASRAVGAKGRMVGLPIRMIYCFSETDPLQRRLRRTLRQQELLQRGVLTFLGFMLPSLAHGEAALAEVIAAYGGALARVEEVAAENSFARYLEIPLLD